MLAMFLKHDLCYTNISNKVSGRPVGNDLDDGLSMSFNTHLNLAFRTSPIFRYFCRLPFLKGAFSVECRYLQYLNLFITTVQKK